jgi:hypothetical protein
MINLHSHLRERIYPSSHCFRPQASILSNEMPSIPGAPNAMRLLSMSPTFEGGHLVIRP